MHALDEALIGSCPTVTVPKYGMFAPLTENKHRLLVADDGLWFEARRPWMHLIWPLARNVPVTIPYGRLAPHLKFSFNRIPDVLLDRFLVDAFHKLPDEHAAWLLWNDRTGALEYCDLEAISRDVDRIKVRRPKLQDHLHFCVDLHSHGRFAAGFSLIDNEDDGGEFKIAGVFGNLDQTTTTDVFRLCAGGLYIKLPSRSAKD